MTQLIAYQCGGPQVYTGRGMAASHKHLSITDEEWESFMDGLFEVCDERHSNSIRFDSIQL